LGLDFNLCIWKKHRKRRDGRGDGWEKRNVEENRREGGREEKREDKEEEKGRIEKMIYRWRRRERNGIFNLLLGVFEVFHIFNIILKIKNNDVSVRQHSSLHSQHVKSDKFIQSDVDC